VILSKIEQITENGVSFEEDSEAVASLREYYDSFSQNESVVRSFVEQGIDKKVESLEKAIDSDEENDLAKAFEDAVAQINTPITLATSLKNANDAWNTLQNALETDDVLAESTVNARSLFVSYALRYEELLIAKEEADVINEMISKLVISPDLTTRDSIEFIETKISDWMQKFNIEAENANMVNDLTPSKTAYERAISEIAALYEAYKNAVEKIGKVTQCSKPDIDNALKSYESIKDYKDADVILSLESPHTVAELYELIEESLEHYNRIVDKITSIRNEIDRLHDVDPDVTHEEISALDVSVSELLALEITLDALNTDEKDYVELLGGARLLPHKNDAFREIKSTYDKCYEMANNDRDVILELVSIKDSSLNDVERATSVEEINKIVEKAVNDFNACLK
jgi:tetratricopeptide (TPR) repeat protein